MLLTSAPASRLLATVLAGADNDGPPNRCLQGMNQCDKGPALALALLATTPSGTPGHSSAIALRMART